jgi:hypothetical protein
VLVEPLGFAGETIHDARIRSANRGAGPTRRAGRQVDSVS